MKKRFLRPALFFYSFALLLLGRSSLSAAEIPLKINFQGVFSTGSIAFDFYITSARDSSSRLPAGSVWTEHVSTTTTDGVISHILGSQSAIPRSLFTSTTTTRYLEVALDGASSFLELVAVPYSFRASYADELAGGSTVQGTLNVSGNLKAGRFEGDGSGLTGLSGDSSKVSKTGDTLTGSLTLSSSAVALIITDGNAGIGTASPLKKLHVTSSGQNARAVIENSDNGGAAELNLLAKSAGGTPRYFNLFNSAGDRLGIWTTDAGDVLSIKQSGDLGLGTISPKARFNLDGGDATRPTFWVEGSSNVIFTNSGNLGIGTQTPYGKLSIYGTGEQALVVTRSDMSNKPTFEFGRIIAAGDGDPEVRFLYHDDATPERAVFEFDKKGIIASVKTGVGSHFEGFMAGEGQPVFRLNSYPAMQLEFGPGGSAATDIALRRAGTSAISFVNQATDGSGTERERVRISSTGYVGIGTNAPRSALQVIGYIQMDITSGAPAAADCDEDTEKGRMKFDATNNLLYLCRGTSGWSSK